MSDGKDLWDLAYEKHLIGCEFWEVGDAASALLHLRKAFSLFPRASTCKYIALALRSLGEDDEADEWVAKAFEINPNNDKGAKEYAEVLIKQKRIEEAKTILQKTIERNPDYKPAARILASLDDTKPE